MGSPRARTVLYIDKERTTSRNLLEALTKAGYEVHFTSDFIKGCELMLNGYWHLAILSDRFVNECPPSNEAYFPNVKKILYFTQDRFWDDQKRTGLLERACSEDEVESRNLPDALRIINRFFSREYEHFKWDLELSDQHNRSVRLFDLAHLISPSTPDEYLVHRANEIEDLLRMLFYEDCQVKLSPPLWVEDGLAALEAQSLCQPGYRWELFLLKIGQKEQLALDGAGYEACRPDTDIAGVIKEIQSVEMIHFGGSKCQLSGRRGQGGQLKTVAALLNQHADPGQVARTYFDMHRPRSDHYINYLPSRVDEIQTVRQILHLPDNETAIQQVINRAERISQAGLLEGGSLQIEKKGETDFDIQIWDNDAQSLHLRSVDLHRALHSIDQIKVQAQATAIPRPFRLDNLIVEDLDGQVGLAWPSDFRGEKSACMLFTLTHCEAELRYNFVRRAALKERLGFERYLIEPTETVNLNAPAFLAARQVIAEVRALAADLKLQNYQAGLLLNALARFISTQSAPNEPGAGEDALLLLASLAQLCSNLLLLTHQQGYRLEKGPGKNQFRFNGKPFELPEAQAEVLNALIEKMGQIFTYKNYIAFYTRDSNSVNPKNYIELLQKYISLIRKAIDDVAGDELKGIGSKIIVSIKGKGYKLMLDPLESGIEDSRPVK